MFTKMEFHVLIIGIDKSGKTDLEEAVSTDELAQYLDINKLDERDYKFEAVSAFEGMGIKEGVNWLVDAMERSKRSEMLRLRAGSNIVNK